ncbi:MAG: hypothetical protein DWQ34_06590 [Planctomycetota bacterium]|nr:MAG: hypothetical protein DWQ29_06870 [Planctomycetota bacterium]REJ95190.1 MAG: hypothetical protein DWQ34_06590 [Planctomycetota bacterium]REK25035.1 MAG: hypothetical protein DWQ41_12740 [Planctomycetota bacterium]REK28099.1 MAG: hypothetical protein DWQ45_25065 [Planctomycetota bacterium]
MPLDDSAKHSLLCGDVSESTRVESVEFASNAEFYAAWNTGVFRAINAETGLMIDDFENEVVPAQLVSVVGRIVKSTMESVDLDDDSWEILQKLADLCATAKNSDMPLFFVL